MINGKVVEKLKLDFIGKTKGKGVILKKTNRKKFVFVKSNNIPEIGRLCRRLK